MRRKFTDLVFILDRSGSMSGLEQDTITGFNDMIERQKREPGQALVTTVLFDDQYQMIHDRVPLEELRAMDTSQYYVRGCTALLDSVGRTISHMIGCRRDPELEHKVIFVIITDGLENASREYSYQKVKQLIRQQRDEYGWEFIFLGADMDAAEEASKIGIREEWTGNYRNDAVGIGIAYEVISETVSCMRMDAAACEGWKERLEQDMARRSRRLRK